MTNFKSIFRADGLKYKLAIFHTQKSNYEPSDLINQIVCHLCDESSLVINEFLFSSPCFFFFFSSSSSFLSDNQLCTLCDFSYVFILFWYVNYNTNFYIIFIMCWYLQLYSEDCDRTYLLYWLCDVCELTIHCVSINFI